MVRNFAQCLAFTLEREGGFVNNPKDPGGATNLGITRATLSRWIKRPASVEEVKALTRPVASQIFHDWYWRPIAGDALPSGIDLMVFDMGVNSGDHESAVELQEVLGIDEHDVDGDIGPYTLGFLDRRNDVEALIDELAKAQEARYRSLRGFPTFGNGWLHRLALRTQAAKALLSSQ
jgi:lysozyme family protein